MAQEMSDYQPLNLPEPTRDEGRVVRNMIYSGELTNKDLLKKAVHWELSQLTKLQKNAENNLADVRQEFKKRYLQRAGKEELPLAFEEIRKLAFEFLKPLTTDQYHPFTRVNAMLLIGDLNEKEHVSLGKVPPKPWKPALEFMLEQLEGGKLPSGIQAAALWGVDRHARFGIDSKELKQRAQQYLLSIAKKSGQDTHPWMRRRAIRALGHLNSAGEQGEVVDLLLKVAGNSEEAFSLRGEALRSIGYIDQRPLRDGNFAGQAYLAAQVVLETAAYQGDSWPSEKVALFREVCAMAETAIEGPDPQLLNPTHHGPVPEGLGIRRAAEVNDADALAKVRSLKETYDPLLNLLFGRDPAIRKKDLDAQIGQLRRWVQSNPIELPDAVKNASTEKPAGDNS